MSRARARGEKPAARGGGPRLSHAGEPRRRARLTNDANPRAPLISRLSVKNR